MSDPDGPESSPGGGGARALWVTAALLAVAATAVLVLSDDTRLLRLGLVAALWAALIGAFGVVKLRNRIDDDDERADQMRRIYELELEREVAARQEFEAEAENEARREAADESKGEIEALRAELRNLRECLETMAGGDLMFERVALRAESTRVRSVESGERQQPDNRVIPNQPQQYRGRELPAAEGNPELMNRLAGQPPSQRPQQPVQNGSAPGAPRPQYVRPHPRAQPGEGSRPGMAAPSNSPPPLAQPGEGSRPGMAGPSNSPPPLAQPGGGSRPGMAAPSNSPPPLAQPGEGSRPGMAAPSNSRPVAYGPPGEGSRPQMRPPPSPEPSKPQPSKPASPAPQPPTPQPSRPQPSRPQPSKPASPAPQSPNPQPPKPAQSAPDEKSPSAPKASPAAAGAHTEGTSVNDLLAAFGNNQESRSHRRRRE